MVAFTVVGGGVFETFCIEILDTKIKWSIFSVNAILGFKPFFMCRIPIHCRFSNSVCDVLIGFEFGGKTHYRSEKPTYTRYKEPALKAFSEDINSAFRYRIPHSSYRVLVTIDLADFISGQLLDKNGKSIVNESYFNYSDESNGIYVSEMYIDVNDEVFQSGGTVYVGMYDKTGRLFGLRMLTSNLQNNTVPIDEILPKGGYIKIMPWGKNINPLSNADKFWG